jgi:hypothetical protein
MKVSQHSEVLYPRIKMSLKCRKCGKRRLTQVCVLTLFLLDMLFDGVLDTAHISGPYIFS